MPSDAVMPAKKKEAAEILFEVLSSPPAFSQILPRYFPGIVSPIRYLPGAAWNWRMFLLFFRPRGLLLKWRPPVS
jgi:hypothetical protein